ncbi:MAG TPA: CBS domain-containing protein [Marinobacter sp.]|nr:CBS domain-containing protein [Marinobacter sp.]
MDKQFHTLPVRDLARTYSLATAQPTYCISPNDSAVHMLTDFCQHKPVALSSDMNVTEARLWMKMADTAFKLVENAAGECVGIITVADINGEQPLSLAHRRGVSAGEIQVKDLMCPLSNLPATSYQDLCNATAGDLINTFQAVHHEYILVVDDDRHHAGAQYLRGIIPAAQLIEHLRVPIDLDHRASSFSEIVNVVQGNF